MTEEDDYPETTDDECDDSSTLSLTPSVDRGISLSLKRQLLEDIDNAGGIEVVKVSELFVEKPDIYGDKNTATGKAFQVKVRNLVNTWKSHRKRGKFGLTRRKLYLDPSDIDLPAPLPFNVSPPQKKRAIPPSSPARIMTEYAGK
jgi:hypothetical protein